MEKDLGLMSEFLVTDWLLKRESEGKGLNMQDSVNFRDEVKRLAFGYFGDLDEIIEYRYQNLSKVTEIDKYVMDSMDESKWNGYYDREPIP